MSARNKAAIAGIGQTEYSKNSGRTELRLACQAIIAALADAGLTAADVDGLVRYDMDNIDDAALTSHLGFRNLGWMSQTGYGGTGGNAVIAHAAAAITAGLAEVVVCFRSLNERSGVCTGRPSRREPAACSHSSTLGGCSRPFTSLPPLQDGI